jgi:hypothetical protein
MSRAKLDVKRDCKLVLFQASLISWIEVLTRANREVRWDVSTGKRFSGLRDATQPALLLLFWWSQGQLGRITIIQ